jgi:hypothetical protein
MSAILSLVVSHVLVMIEQSLLAAEPQLQAEIIKEIEVLITKLQTYISSKNPSLASVINPVLQTTEVVADAAVEAGATAAVDTATSSS